MLLKTISPMANPHLKHADYVAHILNGPDYVWLASTMSSYYWTWLAILHHYLLVPWKKEILYLYLVSYKMYWLDYIVLTLNKYFFVFIPCIQCS